jgi:pilus assembly protein Flp/PilA
MSGGGEDLGLGLSIHLKDVTMRELTKKPFEQVKGIAASQKGQGLVEYALILVLIAIVVIAAIKNVGLTANSAFSTINSGLTTQ